MADAAAKPVLNVADVPLKTSGHAGAVAAGIRNGGFATATCKGMGGIQLADYWDGEA